MMPPARTLMLVLAAASAAAAAAELAACARPTPPPPAAAPAPEPEPEPPRVTSNILRADYAGSAACADCHEAELEAWRGSPMHQMTRVARRGVSQAPIDGVPLRVGNDAAVMEERDGRRFVRVTSGYEGDRIYRVTKVIGNRYREDYVGVDVTGAADPFDAWNVERVLPISYVFETRRWRYKGYSVMSPERPGIRVRAAWSQKCIGCHNTAPYLAYLYDDLRGPAAASYQGRVSDDLLPPARTWRFEVLDDAGLRRAIADEVARVGGAELDAGRALPHVLDDAIRETRHHLGGADLVEVGIGCEACHGGAAEHVEDPDVRPSFELESPLLQAHPPGGGRPNRAQAVNRVCARCHTVLFSEYEWTWEGRRRTDPQPGGSTTNSGEARDFQLGGCSQAMACTTCHDPHAEDRRVELDAMTGPAGDAICTACHPALAEPAAVAAHTRHPPGPGRSCVACHMPRKNMGLGYDLVRYHRIGSPNDRARVLGDRPLECALCHADATVAELAATMERWWGKRYPRDELRALYGDDLDVRVLTSTLARGKPHEQAVAAAVLGERGAAADIPAIAPLLSHVYPLVRYFAARAVERLTGEPLGIDVGRPAIEVRAEVDRWLAATRR